MKNHQVGGQIEEMVNKSKLGVQEFMDYSWLALSRPSLRDLRVPDFLHCKLRLNGCRGLTQNSREKLLSRWGWGSSCQGSWE